MTRTPPFVHIETTNKCNLKCDMCGNKVMRRKRKNIPIDFVHEAFVQIQKWEKKPTVLFHTVGEPLLHPHISSIVYLFLFESIPVHLYTNGTISNIKLFSHILKERGNCITFSLGHFESYDFQRRLESIQNILQKANRNYHRGEVRLRVITERHGSDRLNKELVELSNNLKEKEICLEVTFEGNQGGHNPRFHKSNDDSYWRACSLPSQTLVINNEGYLGYCVIDFENQLISSWRISDELLAFWNSSHMDNIRKKHETGNRLIGTQCEFCSCRHDSWKRFISIYRGENA